MSPQTHPLDPARRIRNPEGLWTRKEAKALPRALPSWNCVRNIYTCVISPTWEGTAPPKGKWSGNVYLYSQEDSTLWSFQKPNASSYFTSILKSLANNSLLAVVRGTALHLWSAKRGSKLFRFGFRVPNTWCGEGNGIPLQYSCLENPMDGGAW